MTQKGELVTILTIIGIGILAVGTVVGSYLVKRGPLKSQSSAYSSGAFGPPPDPATICQGQCVMGNVVEPAKCPSSTRQTGKYCPEVGSHPGVSIICCEAIPPPPQPPANPPRYNPPPANPPPHQPTQGISRPLPTAVDNRCLPPNTCLPLDPSTDQCPNGGQVIDKLCPNASSDKTLRTNASFCCSPTQVNPNQKVQQTADLIQNSSCKSPNRCVLVVADSDGSVACPNGGRIIIQSDCIAPAVMVSGKSVQSICCTSPGASNTQQIIPTRSVSSLQNVVPSPTTIVLKYKPADVNHDNIVNVLDYSRMVTLFGKTGANLAEDLNGDGIINDVDISLLLRQFGLKINDNSYIYNR